MNGSRERAESGVSPAVSPPAIPDMELLRRIGKGGFGEVWLARNQTTGGLRAVKVVPLRGAASADPAGREIVSLSCLEQTVRVRDPNLVTIHHVGMTADHLFYIMDPADDISGAPASCGTEYAPANLAVRLRAGLVADDCVRWARQLLSALACLHQQGLVHRDVKPSNCLFIGGELKLADFGLLTQADRGVSRVGTLSYMPPDGVMDMRADVYAAGLVVYEMITGSPVSRFPALQSRAKAILADVRLSALNRLALKACDPDRNARFADASEMLEELERLPGSEAVANAARSNRPSAARSTRFRRRVLIALSSGLGLLTVAGFLAWRLAGPVRVDVNFITDRFDATICLDGELLRDPEGAPYTTPCNVPDLSADVHQVVFKHPGLADLEVGRIDFTKTRELVAHWPDGVGQRRTGPQSGR